MKKKETLEKKEEKLNGKGAQIEYEAHQRIRPAGRRGEKTIGVKKKHNSTDAAWKESAVFLVAFPDRSSLSACAKTLRANVSRRVRASSLLSLGTCAFMLSSSDSSPFRNAMDTESLLLICIANSMAYMRPAVRQRTDMHNVGEGNEKKKRRNGKEEDEKQRTTPKKNRKSVSAGFVQIFLVSVRA